MTVILCLLSIFILLVWDSYRSLQLWKTEYKGQQVLGEKSVQEGYRQEQARKRKNIGVLRFLYLMINCVIFVVYWFCVFQMKYSEVILTALIVEQCIFRIILDHKKSDQEEEQAYHKA